MPSILVYAELLLNIRHVTVFLILPSDPNPDTIASLSSDRRSIFITHQGEKQGLDLPCQVASIAASDLPLTKLKELSFRLQVATDLDLSQSQRQSLDNKGAPWAALSMTPESRIACRSCKNTLVKESIPVWKDLPSEDWAEMMDFWHCHKPNTEDAHSIHTHELTKGYAASNQIAPSRGVGLVNLSHILLFEDDCTGLQTSESDLLNLECSSCSKPIGLQLSNRAVQLFKWNISVQLAKDSAWESYPVQKFISAQLRALIRSQATHKFIAYSGDIRDSKEALLLWVFNPDLIYSTSIQQGGPKHAMKIFYRSVSEPSSLAEKHFMVMEELRLPDYVLHSLHANLKATSRFLPATARKFQEWDVGLLDY